MKRSRYGEPDYAFGQLMLTLRTHIGLTQASLAQQLGVSRRAVSTWELGSNYPATAHLQELIVLGMRASAFPAGHEEEEIRALWRAAHQKGMTADEAKDAIFPTLHDAMVRITGDDPARNQAFKVQFVDWYLHRVFDELDGPLTDAIAPIPPQ